jgi:hypothetical protein
VKFSKHRFILSFFVFAIALLLEFRISPLIGWMPSLVLVILIVLSSFLNLLELLFYSLLAVWIFNFAPGLQIEILTLGLLPIIANFIKDILPWSHWLNNIILIINAVTLFYLIADYAFIIKIPLIFIEDLILSSIFGIASFTAISYLFNKND